MVSDIQSGINHLAEIIYADTLRQRILKDLLTKIKEETNDEKKEQMIRLKEEYSSLNLVENYQVLQNLNWV